ncbi:hypothetical protein CROQUDRAFT_480799 [Cronartium quercuum f. sp. fusiforme G11]|uniref:Uncharacterized protein n=1 Tax=Cronartium quercuum f. sp. fusiforme G11 TaxID=708437 RepID=A0A9P6TCF6_9BASI|nr:hypothetical protein CROQUDRAFT_480799 [Cronartium quercuum f. sp. fusiforme G11]
MRELMSKGAGVSFGTYNHLDPEGTTGSTIWCEAVLCTFLMLRIIDWHWWCMIIFVGGSSTQYQRKGIC